MGSDLLRGDNSRSRDTLIEYLSPEIRLFPCKVALMFGSRHAQEHLVSTALELFHAELFEHVVLTGGRTQGLPKSEAAELMERMVGTGMPKARLVLEERSMNTGENVANTRELLGSGISEILLIGKIYAKRRYAMTVKAQWPEISRLCCFGINYFGVEKLDWWKCNPLKQRIFSEARKLQDYLAKGYVQEVAVSDKTFIL
jgi:uncharacterized SAM-binding protein YcdF (DUF218 family)